MGMRKIRGKQLLILFFCGIFLLVTGCTNYKGKDGIEYEKARSMFVKYQEGSVKYEEALEAFEKFIKEHPKTRHINNVKKSIKELKKIQEEKREKEIQEEKRKFLNKVLENGYKGISWGTNISDIFNLVSLESAGNVEYKIEKGIVTTALYRRKSGAVNTYYEFYKGRLFKVNLEYEYGVVEPQEILSSIRGKYGEETRYYSKNIEDRPWRRFPDGRIPGYTNRWEEIFIWENDATKYEYTYVKKQAKWSNGRIQSESYYKPQIEIWSKEIERKIDDEIKEINSFRLKKEKKEKMQLEEEALDSI